MMTAKLEIDVRGLLSHCEELANEDGNDWRLKKYIKSLNTMIQELDEQEDKPPEKQLEDYRSRFKGLKLKVNFVEGSDNRLARKIKDPTSTKSVMKEINQIHDAKYTTALRSELLEQDGSFTSLRHRRGDSNATEASSVKEYEDAQEKIAGDMLILARNLKDQTVTSNKILKRDIEAVQNSTKVSDKNFGSLKKESEKLEEHNNRACKCWMWMMIGTVMVIFIFMVLFMKIMKKKVQ